MGGIGVTISSKEEGQDASQSTPLTNLPQKLVDEIASKLGIETEDTKRSLAAGKIEIPDNVEITITRKKNNDSCTIKKLRGGAEFELKYKGRTFRITP
jgi:hypothetical protein